MTNLEIKRLQNFVKSDEYDVLLKLVSEKIGLLNSIKVKGPSSFETIWRTAQKEAKIEGLKEFFDSLEQLTLND